MKSISNFKGFYQDSSDEGGVMERDMFDRKDCDASVWCKCRNCRSSHAEVFLGKSVQKICSKFTEEHSCRSVILIKTLCKFIEITLRHGCSPVNLLRISRTPFLRTPLGGCFWNCSTMKTEMKCLCCQDVEAARNFNLYGIFGLSQALI